MFANSMKARNCPTRNLHDLHSPAVTDNIIYDALSQMRRRVLDEKKGPALPRLLICTQNRSRMRAYLLDTETQTRPEMGRLYPCQEERLVV